MPPTQSIPPPSPSLTVSDISYILFRHKWKILICTLLGLAAAGVAYKMRKPTFQSDAKLYIRYVLSDQQMGPLGTKDGAKSPDQRGETIMSSEMEILTSADLAKQVADAIGPEKILAKAGGGKDPVLAADLIRKGLNVDVPYRSSVIHISFKHPDPDIVQPVLRQLVESYLKMHRDVHQALGISGDFITQETDQLRARLAQTEQDLQKARIKAGIYSSIEDAKRMNAEQIAAVRLQLFNVQADLAARMSAKAPAANQAASASAGTSAAAAPAPAATEPPPAAEPPKAKIDEYAALVTRIETLNRAHNQLLLQYTPENPRVGELRAQIATAEDQRQKLEQEFPQLGRVRVTNAPAAPIVAGPVTDPAAEIAALQARVKVLNAQLEQLTNDANKVADVEVTIAELRRRRDMDEANYRRFAERLEQIRLDESSGAGRVSNISVVEAPTFPSVDAGKAGKVIGAIAIGGLAIGIAWALAIELYIDRSIKRPVDVERNFRMPLFLSLPELKQLRAGANGRRNDDARPRLAAGDADAKSPTTTALAAETNPLRVYHETLRDRLIGFFESVNLTHKPKLVAVTSVGRSAGVTTTAAGLSQSLSEIGEGNVLLVDMTAGQGSAQQFLKGKPVSDLDDVLAARDGAHVQENLYVVTADSNSEKLSRNLPQRFTKLVPKLKASDFDYIIFDLPPVSQISITPRLAGFMDMVLLVIESEKTDRELLDRATKLLGQSKTHVGAVLNKTRNYGPSRQQTELLCGM